MDEFPITEDDQAEHLEFMNSPASDGLIASAAGFFGDDGVLPNYYRWIDPNAMEILRSEDVLISTADWFVLNVAIRTAISKSANYWSGKKVREREVNISKTVKKLKRLLQSRDEGELGWSSYYWDDENGKARLDDYVDRNEFMGGLSGLEITTEKYIETLNSGLDEIYEIGDPKNMPVARYFYWQTLIGFWIHRLGRGAGTSSKPDSNDRTGPFVRFVQVMSSGGLNANEVTGNVIRDFHKRHKEHQLFDPEFWKNFV